MQKALPFWGFVLLMMVAGCSVPGLGERAALFIATNAITSTVAGTAFNQPFALDIDGAGNLYVADYADGKVWKIDPSGTPPVLLFTLNVKKPTGVAVAANGTVYIVAFDPNTANSGEITRVLTDATSSVIASGTQLGDPYGGRVVGKSLYFSDHAAGRVGVVNLMTNVVTTLAPVVANASGLTIAPNGELYVTTAGDHTVVKFPPSASSAGTPFVGLMGNSGFADGPSSSALLNYPQGVALDKAGNLYIADTFNNAVRKVNPQGVVSTVAGQGPSLPGSTDGNILAATFSNPTDVVVDADGNLYVADSTNGLIRKITFWHL